MPEQTLPFERDFDHLQAWRRSPNYPVVLQQVFLLQMIRSGNPMHLRVFQGAHFPQQRVRTDIPILLRVLQGTQFPRQGILKDNPTHWQVLQQVFLLQKNSVRKSHSSARFSGGALSSAEDSER